MDSQAVLFDLPARKFHILGLTFWPQDFPMLAFLLIIAAYSPVCRHHLRRTHLVRLYLPADRVDQYVHVAGAKDRGQPQPAHQAGQGALVSMKKFTRKVAKHGSWLFVAFITGLTFVGYFYPVSRTLVADLATLSAGELAASSGRCSLPWPPISTPAGCANRSANTCAPMHASSP